MREKNIDGHIFWRVFENVRFQNNQSPCKRPLRHKADKTDYLYAKVPIFFFFFNGNHSITVYKCLLFLPYLQYVRSVQNGMESNNEF